MKKILCVGSITADVIVKPANEMPAPGTLVAVDTISVQIGGCAANCAVDLAKLGVGGAICCKVGDDCFGRFVIQEFERHGVDATGVIIGDVDTTASVVLSRDDGERSFFHSRGSASHFTDAEISDELIEKCDIFFIAGAMLMPALDGQPTARLLKRARALGKFTAMDTAWDFEDKWMEKIAPCLPHLDLFMPSYDEAVRITGISDAQKTAYRFRELGVKNVIIKLGGKGALLLPEGGQPYVLPTYRSIKPVDTTGAGDAFCAGFLAGLAQGLDFAECGRLANATGTHCVMKLGATSGMVSLQEVERFMNLHRSEVEA